MSKKGCYMAHEPWLRYNVCPSCGFVRRSWWAKPLIHKGRRKR